MSKRKGSSRRPVLALDQSIEVPLYKQLYERLRAEILAGQLEAGTRLPSTRGLASELGVSRNTTALAYEMLLLEGYIESRVGDGTRVCELQPEHLLEHVKLARMSDMPSAAEPVAAQLLSRRCSALLQDPLPGRSLLERSRGSGTIFRSGQPDMQAFPYEIWSRLIARHVRNSLQTFSFYQDPQGFAPLREAIATHIGITRGVHCSPEQIIITAGAQGALDLVARTLLDPEDLAWIEDPGYAGTRQALLAAEARAVAVPVDESGIDIEVGRRLSPQARLAVVTPSHQFPTGITMSLQRRLSLLEWARESQAWIIEDDYDSEYRFSGRPLEALQGIDTGDRVIYIGTFSKVLFPSLRLGYLVAPPKLLPGLLTMRGVIDTHPPILEQMVLADFMLEGHFNRHLRRMRVLYQQRRDALVDALTHHLGSTLTINVPEAGMHLVAWLHEGLSAVETSRLAGQYGLHLTPLVQSNPLRREGLIFGFAGFSSDELCAGVEKLAALLV